MRRKTDTGGMSMAKHRISGHAGPTNFNKLMVKRQLDEIQAKPRRTHRMFSSVRELMDRRHSDA